MNREERRRNKKKKSGWFATLVKVFFLTILSIILIGIIGASALVIKYKPMAIDIWKDAHEKISSINDGTFKDKTETVIYDNKGNIIKEIAVHDYEYIDYPNIQENIKKAVIAIEDVRFFEHHGYDIEAMGRAFMQLIRHIGEITQGGSTITQQLAKLQFLSLDRVYSRKIEEIIIASSLEKKYTKQQILEFYLNNVNYGNGAYGIETASRTYFNKPSRELTLSEIAFLTGIPNNPSLYNPVKHMDNTLKRRNLILKKMLEYNFITKEEYEEAIAQKIELNMPKKVYEPESYEVSYALSSATKLLMANQGFEFKYWFDNEEERKAYQEKYSELFTEINQKIRNGGFQIHTTIDMEIQKQLQNSINQKLAYSQSKDRKTGLYILQGAGAVVDNRTGDLVAIVGGRTQTDVANTFNRAFLSYRQPGSTIKPLLVYTPAFERDKLPTTVMQDKHVKNGPKNATNTYAGAITIRRAVEVSVNTIPFQIANKYGTDTLIPYLEKLEFAGLVPKDNNPIIAVGGFTKGTNVLEMVGGYATLANNGAYIKPTGISKIVDVSNQVLYENKHQAKQVYDSGSAYLMTDVLKGVMTNGTAKGYDLKGMTSAGKTGTTNDYKDIWMAGYTPYYSTVIWVGYDTPKPLSNTESAKEIWHDFMTKIHKGLTNKDFEKPDRISYMYVNPYTGEIDKTNNHSWWKRQLVPEIQWEYQEKKKEEARLKAEKEKAERERKLQEEIKRQLKEAGISQEEETKRELKAESYLKKLKNAHIYSPSDYEGVYELMNKTIIAIERVVLEDKKQAYLESYKKQVKRINKERDALENPFVYESDDKWGNDASFHETKENVKSNTNINENRQENVTTKFNIKETPKPENKETKDSSSTPANNTTVKEPSSNPKETTPNETVPKEETTNPKESNTTEEVNDSSGANSSQENHPTNSSN